MHITSKQSIYLTRQLLFVQRRHGIQLQKVFPHSIFLDSCCHKATILFKMSRLPLCSCLPGGKFLQIPAPDMAYVHPLVKANGRLNRRVCSVHVPSDAFRTVFRNKANCCKNQQVLQFNVKFGVDGKLSTQIKKMYLQYKVTLS